MGSFRLRQGPQQRRLAGISWRSTVLGLVLAATLSGVAPSGANAALGVSNGVLTYNARAGDANDIGIAFNGTDYTVNDVVPIDAASSGGCMITGNTATCPATGVSSIRVNASDNDDTVTIDASVTIPTQLFGRDGNDTLSGGSGNDTLVGFTGSDTLIGNDGGGDLAEVSGSDTIDSSTENVRGSAGDDTINIRNGVRNKVLGCGAGQDMVISDPIDEVAGDCEDNNDGVAPAISITSAPSGVVANPRPVFEFNATDKDSFHFECAISGGDSDGDCHSPYQPAANLGDGPHTFTLTAIDKYGNSASATRDFSVDASAPDTRFDSLPPEVVDTSTPSFSFASDDPGATFTCRFDTGDFFECTSPVIPEPPLQNGDHTFEVIATDAAGNVDQTPALFRFTVNATGPAPSPPPNGTTLQKGGSNVIVGSLVLISGRSVKLVRGKLVPVSLTCAGQRRCEGKITVATDKPVRSARKAASTARHKKKKRKKSKPRVQRLGSAHYSIEGNRRAKVLVPLSKSKVRLLKRLKRVKVRATIREVDLKGNPRISMRTFTLRAR
jgi:hypothetical protein